MADPVPTPELLAALREEVAASDAETKSPRSQWMISGLSMARFIVHLADEVARLTRERDEARLQGAREERAAAVAYLGRVANAYDSTGTYTRADEARTCAQDLQRGVHIPKRTRPTEPPVVVVRREVADE